MIRFMKHFVEDTETKNKAKICYSLDNHISNKPCVTLYADGYCDKLFPIFGNNVQNDTDSQSDYFDKDRIRFFEDSIYYNDARKAAIKAQEAWAIHYNKIQAKKNRNNLTLVK
jgi:hypothetical protein